jgi:hypothetical protein
LPLATSFGPLVPVGTLSVALGDVAGGTAAGGRITFYSGDNVATGVLRKQDPSAFSAAAINGDYAFGFSGIGPGPLLAANGRFTASDGTLGAGRIDFNDGAQSTSTAVFAGNYHVDVNGRGLASLEIPSQPRLSNFVFYVVSADEMLFMEIDDRGNSSSPAIGGTALRQSGGPFSALSLNGPTVLNLVSRWDLAVAQQTFDGHNTFSGTLDENNNGAVTVNAPVTGGYTVDADGLGHGTLTVAGDPQKYAFYLVSPDKAFIIDGSGRAGAIEPQTVAPFTSASVSGQYSLGTLPDPETWWSIGLPWSGFYSGSLTLSEGAGLLGTLDGAVTDQAFAGGYAVAANGRATLMLNPQIEAPWNSVFYFVSPTKAVGIPMDAQVSKTGIIVIEK